MKRISFVIPCYRSQDTIDPVVDGIRAQFVTHPGYDYRIILSCDGSPDNVFERIRALCASDSNIIGLDLSKNYGQQSARMAALAYVEGDYVVFMDDDGQHPPEGIFPLVECLESGADIAYADFRNKQHSALQRIGSRVNAYMTEKLVGKPRHVHASSFFATNAFVAKKLEDYTSPSPYILGYLLQITHKIDQVKMEHRQRIAGKSGYSFRKLLTLWMHGLTGFSVVPLRVSSLLGCITAIAGFAIGLIIIIRKLLNPSIAAGYSSLMAAILFVGGMVMLLLGLLGEYVGRMFMSLNNLPQYIIREALNVQEDENPVLGHK